MKSFGYFIGLILGWFFACFALGFALYLAVLFGAAGWHTAEWFIGMVTSWFTGSP